MRPFRRTIVAAPTLDAFRAATDDYEVMIVAVLDALLARFERHGGRYPFIDTKLDLVTGEDFPEGPDFSRDFKGRTAIFPWIQGRGLESLAGHAKWLAECSALSEAEKSSRLARIREMAAAVLDSMERLRAPNGGKLSFMMTPEGEPFDMGPDGRRKVVSLAGSRSRFSDLFYAKGMFAAAALLGRKDPAEEAKRLFRAVIADAEAEAFERDAISFDPRNPARAPAKGQFAHGPRMIAVGGCALFAELTGEREWLDAGDRLVRFILARHANLPAENSTRCRFPELRPHDFFEHRDSAGQPFSEDGGVVRSDPGHVLEFVGLAAKLLLARVAAGVAHPPSGASFRSQLPAVFVRNFTNGYSERIGGICKSFDLISRRPLNADMPWWNLPETMRAAAELLVICPEAPERQEILAALVKCSNGFMSRFVNPRVHLMAYQTIDPDGRPVSAIPATPDADPGYHTGLSLIDMLRSLRKLG